MSLVKYACQGSTWGIDNGAKIMPHYLCMKKKSLRRVTHHRAAVRHSRPTENYLVVVRSWMLVVAFALMLGVGAVVGTFMKGQLDQSTPTVAGASTSR